MTILFTEPSFVPVSGNSVVYPGAKLYFYETGTSNLQNTYSEYTLTTAHANPVVADADGRFAPIYLDPSLEDYKVVLKDSSDVTIWTVDPYSAVNNTTNLGTISGLLAASTALGTVSINGYHTAGDGGGGEFYWDASQDKANHNGGTIIDPDVTFPSDWTNQPQVATWFTAGTGTGCWVRIYSSEINAKWFGAKGDGGTDNSKMLQSVFNYASVATNSRAIYIPEGTYKLNTAVTATATGVATDGVASIKLFGAGAGRTIIDTRVANSPCMIFVTASGLAQTQWHLQISDFEITNLASPAVLSSGIEIQDSYQWRISDLYIHDLTGDGIYIPSTGNDYEIVAKGVIEYTQIDNCANFGINGDSTASFLAYTLELKQCYVTNCGAGGATLPAEYLTVSQCDFAYNGLTGTGGGVTVYGVAGYQGHNVHFYQSGFEANYGHGIKADRLNNVIIEECQSSSLENSPGVWSPAYHYKLGEDNNVTHAEVINCQWKAGGYTGALVAVKGYANLNAVHISNNKRDFTEVSQLNYELDSSTKLIYTNINEGRVMEEHGSWTPTCSVGAVPQTFTSNGTYRKQGSMVVASCVITGFNADAAATAELLTFGGLPYAAATTGDGASGVVGFFDAYIANTGLAINISAAGKTFVISNTATGAFIAWSNITGTNRTMRFSMTYFVD